MAGVAPNGNIWLLRGVPIDAAHTKTYRPKSAADQFTAFSGYTKYTLTEQTYIRHSINSIRVEYSADNVIDCNYMIFQNSAFSNKYFYAFITDVEYVSNNTCRIVFDIDNLQTYYFDIAFLPSLIAREHSATDNIGDSVTPEPVISTGEEIVSRYQPLNKDIPTGLYTVIVTSRDLLNPQTNEYFFATANEGNFAGASIAGAYNVCNVVSDTLSDFFTVINNYISVAGENGILAMYCIPRMAYTGNAWDSEHTWLAKNVAINTSAIYTQSIPKPIVTDTLNGYLPKNKKLYTYPFCYLKLHNSCGSYSEYRYEYFTTDNVVFRLSTSGTAPDQSVYCTPQNYRGFNLDWESSLIYDTYPASSFNTTAYSNYIGNNSYRLLAGQMARIVSAVTTAAGGFAGGLENPIGTITNLANNTMSGVSEYAALQDLRRQTSTLGGMASGYFNLFFDQNFFVAYRVTLNATVAQQYDDYFTRFGYSVNSIKTPNFWIGTGRTRYNYCKTHEANIKSKSMSIGVPMGALSDIVNIFNNGICLWEKMSDVGVYSDNPVRE